MNENRPAYFGGITVTERRKAHSIQFLRFVAASLVVLFHAHLALATDVSPNSASKYELYLFGFGAVGVHIFFVISGYIMVLTNPVDAKGYSAKRFFRKRIIRIYPIYWLLAIVYILVNTMIGSGYDFSVYRLVSALLLFPDNAALIIGPAWTLSYEMYFYFMFGLAMLFGRLRGIIILSVFFSIAMGLGILFKPSNAALALATNSLLIEFLFGAWIAYFTTRLKFPKLWGIVALLASVSLFAVGISWGYENLPSAIIWGVPSALLILAVVILEGYYQPVFIEKLSPLGDSSYTLYLAHILIITLLVFVAQWLGITGVPLLVMTLIFAGVAIAISHWFHLIIELPMTRALNRWLS
ncbi:MAG: acyltransferase [Parasphingorhabdus sp.]|uniref:acyltransferase family protein n=1 Tax=Parasphingorhabdus sp. TaxID=2709688 RepID=UPI003299B65A